MSLREEEYSEYVWAVCLDGAPAGIADDLNKVEQVLRSNFLSDNDWSEEDVGNRLTFDLKFSTWLLFFDHLPQWGYTADRVPKL